jgi:hypothetical protein
VDRDEEAVRMRRWPVRIGATAAGLSLLLAGTAACGGASSDSSQAVASLVAAVPDKTTEAGTARLTFTADTQVLGRALTFTGRGLFDFASHTGRFSFSIPALLGDRAISEILTAATLYLKVPGVGPAGKYYAVDLGALGGGQNPLAQLGNTDPTAGLEALRGVSSDVHKSGTATVRGAGTTRYQGTIDAALAVEKAPSFVRQKVRQLFTQVKTIPFEVYVDGDGRLRKLTEHIAIPASAATAGQAVTADLTFELYDFGVPVHVTAPPKNRQVDGSQLLRQLQGGAE